MNKLIYGKRIVARIIDIAVPTFLSLLGLFFYANSHDQSLRELDIDFVQIIIWIFYIIFILVTIIQLKNKTYGDLIMKIYLVPLHKRDLKLSNVFSREIFIAILLFIAIEYNYGWFALVIGLIPTGKSKDENIPLIATDIICKSTYISNKKELD